MSTLGAELLTLLVLIIGLVAIHRPLGDYLARVSTSTRHLAVERVVYRVGGIDGDANQTWGRYLWSVLMFSFAGVVALYAFLRVQQDLWRPYAVPTMSPAQAFNTAASFVTNTNWQSCSGRSALG